MDINTLIETFKAALAQDQAMATWAMATYGQTHKVYLNLDIHDPPAEADCPYIVFFPDSKTSGPASGRKRHSFQLMSCVHDDNSVINAENNVIEYTGVKKLESFRKLAENALAGASIGNAVIDILEIDYETIDSFPFMLAATRMEVGEAHIIGVDPLE
jgi:hypothetical protein